MQSQNNLNLVAFELLQSTISRKVKHHYKVNHSINFVTRMEKELKYGRSFTVNKDGTLNLFLMNPPDESKPIHQTPMKVIISQHVKEHLKNQTRYPSGRVSQYNSNDSMNLRDFTHYGSFQKSILGRKTMEYQNSLSLDIRKWR